MTHMDAKKELMKDYDLEKDEAEEVQDLIEELQKLEQQK